MRFLFPFSIVPKGCHIVIYGAGEVGYDFYRQVKTSGYAEVVLWVDRQYAWFRRLNLPVDEPERLADADYDYVIITAENRPVYDSIREDLISMGVSDKKIVWNDDYKVHKNIAYGYMDRDIEAEMRNAVEAEPAEFISGDRLDILIRYLYALEILDKKKDGYAKELYKRLILRGCDAKEPTENYISAYFSEYAYKSGVEAFLESFQKLVLSMNTGGFRKDQFLPVTNTGKLINGAHRLAAALACKRKIWYVSYPFDGLRYVCDAQKLKDMDFTDQDIQILTEHCRNIRATRCCIQ